MPELLSGTYPRAHKVGMAPPVQVPPSNKQGGSEFGTVISLPPIIDKLTLTTDHVDGGVVWGALEDMRQQGLCSPFYRSKQYQQAYAFHLDGGGTILVELVPRARYATKAKDMRVELNPGKPGVLDYFKNVLRPILFDEGVSESNISITRVDFAKDFQNLYPHQFMVYGQGIKNTNVYRNSDGDIESLYLGSKESQTQFIVYDRAAKFSKSKQKTILPQVTRFESRHRPESPISFSDLYGIQPFSRLLVRQFDIPPDVKNPHIIRWLFAAIREVGICLALTDNRDIPTSERKYYLDLIRSRVPGCGWWNPSPDDFRPALDEVREALFH